MPNVINATSTGNGGLITQGDDSGILNIQTNETTAIAVDASQKVSFTNPIQGGSITSGTTVASTSGTSIDFTSIPSWVKRITVMFNTVSTNGASAIIVQAGISTGVVTSGYTNTVGVVTTVNNTTRGATITSGFTTYQAGSASNYSFSGAIVLVSLGSANTWVATGIVNNTGNPDIAMTAGQVALGGTLDRVRITTSNGTDTFDAGSINILYEG